MTAPQTDPFDAVFWKEVADYVPDDFDTSTPRHNGISTPIEVAILAGHSYTVRFYKNPSRHGVAYQATTHRFQNDTVACVKATCQICSTLKQVGNPRTTHHQRPKTLTRVYGQILAVSPARPDVPLGVPVLLIGPAELFNEIFCRAKEIQENYQASNLNDWYDPSAEMPCFVIRSSKSGDVTVGYHFIKATMNLLPDWPPLDEYHVYAPPTDEQVKIFCDAIEKAAGGSKK